LIHSVAECIEYWIGETKRSLGGYGLLIFPYYKYYDRLAFK